MLSLRQNSGMIPENHPPIIKHAHDRTLGDNNGKGIGMPGNGKCLRYYLTTLFIKSHIKIGQLAHLFNLGKAGL
jgi:hypothetical protein